MTIADPPLLLAAAAAAGAQQYPAGALYVVATPIGNLADLSLRAIHVLALVDAVACEDTRVGGRLLARLGLRKPLLALHAHNEAEAGARVLVHLAGGARVACISDAGTPAISDPGAALVAAVVAAGHAVVPIPGPSSALAALSVAGDVQAARAGSGFRFAGFLPAKGQGRVQALAGCAAEASTVVLFEAPHRIEVLGAELAAAMPDRRITIGRELSKQFEQIVTLAAADLPGWLAAEADHRRGEFVLVLHALPAAPSAARTDEPARVLRLLLPHLPLKTAAALAAEISGAPRKVLYRLALDERGAGD